MKISYSFRKAIYTLACLLLIVANSTAQTWGSPVTIESPVGTGGNAGNYSSIITVNGNPAMCYYDVTHASLMYVRTTDANGATWGLPFIVDDEGSVGEFNYMVALIRQLVLTLPESDFLKMEMEKICTPYFQIQVLEM